MTIVCAVIPARNEEGRVGQVIRETLRYVDKVVVVDDGSSDHTREEAAAAGAQVITNHFGQGYIGAVKTGFREAEADVVVTLDADGEHAPSDIPKLVEPIVEGRADLVLGCRPSIPRPSERILNWLARRKVPLVSDTGTGFRAIRSELARELQLRGRCTCGVFVLEAAWRGARIVGVPVKEHSTLTPKRRRIMWKHIPQLVYVFSLLMRKNQATRTVRWV